MKSFINSNLRELLNLESNVELLNERIQKGDIDINKLYEDGSTTLHRAIYLNNIDVARYLLNLKKDNKYVVDVNKKDNSDMTPLALASFCNRVEIVEMLVNREDIIMTNEEDIKDPLSIACMENNSEIVSRLLASGKINLRDKKFRVKTGAPLLHYAYAKNNIELMEELIEHGIDVNDKDKEGLTVAQYVLLHQPSKEIIKLLGILMKGNINCINVGDKYNDTILHYACKSGYIDVVKFLVSKKNLKINIKGNYGLSALHLACLHNRVDIIKALLERKDININIGEERGLTPLHVAASKDDITILDLLVQNGANVNAFDKIGMSPINHACFVHNINAMRALLNVKGIKLDKNNDKDLKMIFEMCVSGYKEILEVLLDKMDISLEDSNIDGNNLLWLACDARKTDVVKMILNREDITTKYKNFKDSKGLTSLHRACCKRHIEIVQLLLEQSDIDVNIKDIEGWTPLHYMTYADYTDVVKVLLEHPRINVNEKDINGCTPIKYACDVGDIYLINMLLEKGGDLTIRDTYGISPIHMVFTRDNEEVKVTIKQAILKDFVEICRNNDTSRLDNLLNICRVVHLQMEKECLRLACTEGSEVIIEYLLRKGVNVNQRYEGRTTLMYYACLSENENIAHILMKYDINIRDGFLERYVNNNKDLDIVKSLIEYATIKFLNACRVKDVKEAVGLLNYDLDIEKLVKSKQNILDIANGDKRIAEALHKNLSKRLLDALENEAMNEVNMLIKLDVDTDIANTRGKTILMHAIDHRYFPFAKKMINEGVNVSACDLNGTNALMYASKQDSTELVELLLSKGLKINAVDKKNKTALMYALENRSNQAARLLMIKGINILAKDINGKSTLMYALENRLYGVTRTLMGKKTYVYADKNERTLLMYAAKGSTVDIIEYMLELGFNVNYVNTNKESALSWALKGKNRFAIEFLLEKGAKVSVLDRKERKALKELTQLDNKTTIMIAAQEYDISKIEQYQKSIKLSKMAVIYAITYGYDPVAKYIVNATNVNMIHNRQTLLAYTINNSNEDMANYLIKNGANVNSKSMNKITALMLASYKGYSKIVKRLIEFGADLEMTDNNGMTAIWYAFLGKRDKETIDYLLNAGAKVYTMCNSSMNMLMYASKYGLEDTVKELMNRGFAVNYTNKERKTALLYALENDHDSIVHILIKNNANISVVKNSISSILKMSKIIRNDFSMEKLTKYIDGRNTIDFFDSLSKRNLAVLRELVYEDMNNTDENGKTTLMYLCENGNKGAKLFINNDIGINDKDSEGNSTLVYAMKGDNKSIIRALICEGADLDASNKNGKTILMYAIELNQEIVLQYRSMNVDSCDNNGDTALMYAVRQGNKEIVEELLLRYADTNIVNKNEKTPLIVAIESGKLKIAKLLINHSLTDVNQQNSLGETAITYAAKYENLSLVKELLMRGAVIPKDKDTILYIKSFMKNDYKMQELVKSNMLSRDKQAYIPVVATKKQYTKRLV